MTNVKRSLNKYYIKQYIINDISFQEWSQTNLSEILDKNKIIGYLFTTLEPKLNEAGKILNLFLIRKEYYDKPSIAIEVLAKDWELFLFKSSNSNKNYTSVFRNPPIDQWLDTKNNWCKKIAGELSKTFQMSFTEALSDVYLGIMQCYNKSNVYMGNLNYIRKTIYSIVLMRLRSNKSRLNLDNIMVCSLNTLIGTDKDGNELTLIDIIPAEEDISEDSVDYQFTLAKIKQLLSDSFSPREIDQLITQRTVYLPVNLYRRLLTWRNKHSVEEVL